MYMGNWGLLRHLNWFIIAVYTYICDVCYCKNQILYIWHHLNFTSFITIVYTTFIEFRLLMSCEFQCHFSVNFRSLMTYVTWISHSFSVKFDTLKFRWLMSREFDIIFQWNLKPSNSGHLCHVNFTIKCHLFITKRWHSHENDVNFTKMSPWRCVT